jgi:ribosomal protein RSM22 (predicted rRNA methylase)
VECCTAPGRVARFKVRKSHSKTVPGIYHAARRSRWGGLWPNVKEFEG